MKLNITIAGGASTYTPGIVKTLLENHKDFSFKELRLYDIEEEKLAEMQIIIDYIIKSFNKNIKLVTTSSPKIAFTDCDYVFSQIRVGGLKMREIDEKIPLKHGLVGQETCGLGGFSYGMRSMGGFLELVGFVQEYAPKAWILNYTNPESIISESVRRKFPDAKIINACDQTQGIEDVIAENMGLDKKNWQPVYYGLNHFGWYDSIYDKSLKRDIMPEIIAHAQKHGMEQKEGDPSWQETYRVFGEIIKAFPDYIPNSYLEYYLYPDMKVEQANPDFTRANEVMNGRVKEIKALSAKISEGEQVDIESSGHGQYIVDIARSVENDYNWRFNLIVPNFGAIPNLRADAAVEVPSYVSSRGVEPIALRKNIPDFHKGLMEAQVAAEKLLVDAFFEGSYLKALQAFTLNQTVPSARVAKLVLDELIEANKGYWPELS